MAKYFREEVSENMSASNGNKDTLGITGANIFILWKATILINVKGVDITVVMYCCYVDKEETFKGRKVRGRRYSAKFLYFTGAHLLGLM